jgi:hypothetical protein
VTNRDLSALVLIGCDGFIGLSSILLLQSKRLTHSHTHNITQEVAAVSHRATAQPGIEPGTLYVRNRMTSK